MADIKYICGDICSYLVARNVGSLLVLGCRVDILRWETGYASIPFVLWFLCKLCILIADLI